MSWLSIQYICMGSPWGWLAVKSDPWKALWVQELFPVCGTSLYENAFGTGSFCQQSPSPLPQLQTSPLIQRLHFVMGLSNVCGAAVISSIATKSRLLQQLQACSKGKDLFGEHHNHPGRKFAFYVVLLESSRAFSLYNGFNEVSFSFKQ